MAAQGSELHLCVESHQAELSQDAGSRKRLWFLQGFGFAGLMLMGVSALGGLNFAEVPCGSRKPSGHDLAGAFQPSNPGSRTGGLGSVKTAVETAQEKRQANALIDVSEEQSIAEKLATSSAVRAKAPRMQSDAVVGPDASVKPSWPTPDSRTMEVPWSVDYMLPKNAPDYVLGGLLSNEFTMLSKNDLHLRKGSVDKVQVVRSSRGEPLDAGIELWYGPQSTKCKLLVYTENCFLQAYTAKGRPPPHPLPVATRNLGQLPFNVYSNFAIRAISHASTVMAGAVSAYTFQPGVTSVQVLLRTDDGRPLDARIELLQGPREKDGLSAEDMSGLLNSKQVIERYQEDGSTQFFAVLETPGPGNTIRIINTAPLDSSIDTVPNESPMTVSVVAHSINKDMNPLVPKWKLETPAVAVFADNSVASMATPSLVGRLDKQPEGQQWVTA